MALDHQQLFEKLLTQLQLPDDTDQSVFQGAELEQLTVHAQSKRWHFKFKLPAILPFQTFLTFQGQLHNAFQAIAQVDFEIETAQPALSNRLIGDYWNWVVQHSGLNSPLVQELCRDQVPRLEDDRVIFMAENEVVKNFLVNQALGPIENQYTTYGFPKFSIHTMVDESASQQKINEFKQQKAQHDAEMAQKAVAALKVANEKREKQGGKAIPNGPTVIGRKIKDGNNVMQLIAIEEEEKSVIVQGYVFSKEIRDLRSGRKLMILEITDYTSSIVVKKFSRDDGDEAQFDGLNEGDWIKVRGSVQEDNFMRDLVLNAYDINQIKVQTRQDTAPEGEKRVELHLHTSMSTMDATNSITDYVKRAKKWGQDAIAITDHAGVQGFPEAFAAGQKNDVKIIYGVEANLVDDGVPIGYNSEHRQLEGATYVIFDVETTGLSAIYDRVIELSAVKMQGKEVIDQFEEFIDPGFHLSDQTTELTSITDDMVRGSKSEKEVFELFREFYGDAIIVGHNVTFDIGFMNAGYRRYDLPEVSNPIIDTLTLARFLYPTLKGYRLNTLAKKFHVALEHHHRAVYDAESTGHLNYIFLKDAEERYQIQYHDQLNDHMSDNDAYKHARPSHAIILAQTQEGLKNLFKLVSMSNVKYFYRVPRVPRSLLEQYREGLLIGSACDSGEVFTAMMQKGYAEARQKAKFFDYLEVQPTAAYKPLIDSGLIQNKKNLQEILANMVKLGDDLDKPVVVTGDTHYLDEHDSIYRKILIHSQGGANPLNRQELPDVHFRTTDELLADYDFLGAETAKKLVVTNTHLIADKIDEVHPLKDKLYTPRMEGAEDEIRERTINTAHEWYGDPLPEIVQHRLDRELKSIIGNGFSVIYLIAQRLVHKSNKDGYLVGSRGSVGSSLVATMTGITEVNPLPPHYRCPNCQHSEFFTKGEYSSGFDLPEKNCPECGTLMIGDGHDIPFETFLGFTGNKVPDIDLNFSGDYQPIAHNYTKVLFGEKNVYRAGTIGTVADKTAYGYVKAYERDTESNFRNAEIDRLAKGATGVKRTTGQHPAGIIVVPDYMEIYDFTPIQYPADDQNAAWQTTHFDFHSIHDNILKIDILGHDDPTMIRMLQDLSGIDPQTIPMDDPGVMALFSGTESLNVTPEQIQSKTGTLGVPEFGTRFVRGMLEETHPSNYSELLQISGLSHGTDVWLGNAEELIKNGTATIANVIGCRDNIMTDLIHWGMDSEIAFQIMEHVRKGRGIPDEWQDKMKEAEVPDWYIDSCLKIKYMFPRAHAAAYILMALRVAYFKVYFPMVYYAAYFSVRAEDFDVVAMSRGKESVKAKMKEINDEGMDASTKEKNLLTVLELANEMLERGFKFKMIDIEKSAANEWLIDGDTLIAPFNSAPGLGLNVAKQIVAAREDKPFLSKEDLAKRGKVSKTLIEFMTDNGVLEGLPDENQLSLFDMM
ncbi:DNA polymerase III subunit alpha [Secundilactobacillus similis DSM 23365 = JCM 2765]|uniref:DNA polymerase III PolC-type n=1 Tax=Secundilactobacillus similis DSM 23365 = JCM 2765 TaxID=1423804 RepID=A0A0R2FCK3_9LACO|nr:PolC-type DNA polymerase III [Secundilactobacillus similis]KRN26160.1 DNA polymerase III PolC [Secundilactobacillus similis DSM 23365 = JCM 2765]